ncbi:YcaO-like family protein [Streptomyces sp. SR27]|uniref:YcaO-like family protein n=1 Tax=Streptomyces sp. SR27 TaxID=3076630 RepID=UPI00295AE04C|nr:YcaO-like family protein [Streptomyces sp. SR27]MDV9187864.1 YcaO-like family protein [Streptomyces sp. SR27]
MSTQPVVFLGPSMPLAEARLLLDADYRRPVRRGDLDAFPAGQVVGIVDGVFEQSLAVSPAEVRLAVDRGVVVYGGGSMGALRAAEVPGVIGIGLVHAWYRDGVVSRDDEVALLFDAETAAPLTVPMVNVRYAIDRLHRGGTIDRPTADRLLAAALELPYKARTHRRIVRSAGLLDRADGDDLVAMLAGHDLKHRDAQSVLEAVGAARVAPVPGERPQANVGRPVTEPVATGTALIWESGDRVDDDELFAFLTYTGRLEPLGRAAHPVPPELLPAVDAEAARATFRSAVRRWGWLSTEEARVTLADLGIDLSTLNRRAEAEAVADAGLTAWARADREVFRRSVRAALFLHDASLKREVMRCGALRLFAERDPRPAGTEELAEAWQVLCKANLAVDREALRQRWAQWGHGDRAAQDAFAEELARARRNVRTLAATMAGGALPAGARPVPHPALGLRSRPKPPGERRFCTSLRQARDHAERLAKTIGITRIGMVGELGDIGGVQIAQAARPDGRWSSTYGSGKGLTEDGAYVGSVMEELEKWAQERWVPRADDLVEASYRELGAEAVDPAGLALPYDSGYTPELPLTWVRCPDLLTARTVLVPLDLLRLERGRGDICFSPRGARKVIATNGLGSGFSLEEALLHGLCEYLERHAQRLAEVALVNPGGTGAPPFRFVDPDTAPDRAREAADRLRRAGHVVRVLDITSEVKVPTFMVTVWRGLDRAEGYGTHPDPGTAVEMALLEAAQSIACSVAGGREDLTIRARSLGRHERPRPIAHEDAWFWLDPDIIAAPLPRGLTGDDVLDDLRWTLRRVADAGVSHVPMLDLSRPETAPGHVVRVIVPGLESNNPFATGERARLTLLRDLLPRWS